jgi:hypothetical protein
MTGMEYRENDVSRQLCRVALADVPSIPAYRARSMTMIAEVIKGLPPQLQAPLVPYFLESTDLPKRQEMAELVRKVLGMGQEEPREPQPDPEKEQMRQMIEQLQQAMQQGAAQVEELNAQVAEKEGAEQLKAQELQIKNRDAMTRAAKTAAEVERMQAEIARIHAQTLHERAQTAAQTLAVNTAQGAR